MLWQTDLSIAHECGVLPHQYVGPKEKHKGMTEAQHSPVQERPEGQQRVFADISVENTKSLISEIQSL